MENKSGFGLGLIVGFVAAAAITTETGRKMAIETAKSLTKNASKIKEAMAKMSPAAENGDDVIEAEAENDEEEEDEDA